MTDEELDNEVFFEDDDELGDEDQVTDQSQNEDLQDDGGSTTSDGGPLGSDINASKDQTTDQAKAIA